MQNVYLSEEWKSHRLEIVKERGCVCENELCPNKGKFLPIALHHISYAHGILAPSQDLLVLCLECHAVMELGKAQKRRDKAKVKRLLPELARLRSDSQTYLQFGLS